MNVGIIGTGAIANLHARVYKRIGFPIVVCTDVMTDAARRFAAEHGCEIAATCEDVCRRQRHARIDE